MNPFVALLVLILALTWVVGSIAFCVIGVIYIKKARRSPGDLALYGYDDRQGDALWGGASLLIGIVGVLVFLAFVTGGISFGHADGCYYLHTEIIGKQVIQQYDAIPCVGQPVQ